MAPKRRHCSWNDAMADAAAAGLTLPSREEAQYMYHHVDQINALLFAHNGDRLPRNNSLWSRTESSKNGAWYVCFLSGYTTYNAKYDKNYSRPLAEFKNLNIL